MSRWLLNLLLPRLSFRIYSSLTPLGRCLGHHDIAYVVDTYIILELSITSVIAFTGYFQTS
jgi:hypothetical protein